MKKIAAICLLAIGTVSVYAKDIKDFVVTTQPPMSCQNCENRIKGNLRFEKGVKKIVTDLKNQRVVVTYDADKTSEQKIEEAFGKLNYKVEKITGNCTPQHECADKKDCCQKKSDCNENCNANDKCKTECEESNNCGKQ